MPKLNLDVQRLSDCIEKQKDPEPFSGVVSLARGDKLLFAKGFGSAIRSESIPNTAETRFQMASGCKIFTSVAICRLVEQNRLSFDTLLSDCVDHTFSNYSPEITIRHLLSHSSGITSYFEEDVDPNYEALWQSHSMYKVRGPRDFLPLFQDKPMKFTPGERFDYNDGGYILLGLVVESITSKKFSEFVRESVFEPAGMTSTGYFPTDQLPERTAYAYIKNDDGTWRTNFYAVPIIGGPDGGAYTTAHDMASFWNALIGNKLLSSETTELMLRTEIATSSKPPYTHYGYGVWIDRTDGSVKKYFVEGLDPGVALRSAVYPDGDLVFTMIGNTSDALWRLYKEIEKNLAL